MGEERSDTHTRCQMNRFAPSDAGRSVATRLEDHDSRTRTFRMTGPR